jgi:hypothetical protein
MVPFPAASQRNRLATQLGIGDFAHRIGGAARDRQYRRALAGETPRYLVPPEDRMM